MAFEALQLQVVNNNILRIDHPSLPSIPKTSLTTANIAAATTLTVLDNAGFSNSAGGDMILIGNLGDEQSEIKEVDGAITAGTSLTVTATTFPHPVNTPVRKIIFDQIEVYGNSTATSSGSTLIATINLDVSAPYTEYVVSGTTYSFYGVRGIRSTATTYNGSYSDFIAAAGFDTNTVGFIIQQAFEAVGEKIASEGRFSKQWAYDQIYLGELNVSKQLKKWSWLQQFEYDAGNVTLGVNSLTLPTDMSDTNTAKAIQGVRIGKDTNLDYITKTEYEYLFQNVANTTVGTTYASGATTIVLIDSRDFDSSGSINVYTAGVIDAVSYTTNTRATATLTGVTSNDSGGTAADPVWQGEPQGQPSRYTVYEGTLYFDTVPDTTTNLVGENIWLDYYKKVTRVNTDGDTVSVPDSLCVQYWLESMIKKHRNGGTLPADDTSWINYLLTRKTLIENEVSGQSTYLVPSTPNEDEVW